VGSELSVIDRSGHLPVLEMPDITNQLLQNWLHESG
jgi:hypothetical protein